MELALDIIVHELEEESFEVAYVSARRTEVRSIRLYNGTRVLDSSFLYLCDSSHIPEAAVLASVPFAYVGSDEPAAPDFALAIRTDVDIVDVFTRIQSIFERYSSWCFAMDQTLFDGGDLQDLFDLAEPILRNHIAAVDPMLRLLAHTKHTLVNDPVTVRLIENGYHTEENIRKFKLHERFKLWETETGFIINDSYEICNCITVVKTFKSRQSLSLIVVMTCNNAAPDPWLLETFELFLSRVQIYTLDKYPADRSSGLAIDVFLRGLADGSITDPAFIARQARNFGIPAERLFCSFFIGLPDQHAVPVKRVLSEVMLNVAPAKVFMMDGGIAVLCFNCMSKTCMGHCHYEGTTIETRLTGVLDRYGLYAGRSSGFYTLEGMHTALKQAQAAYGVLATDVLLTGTTHLANTVRSQGRILAYDDCFFEHLLGHVVDEDAEMLGASTMIRTIERIAHDDEENNTDNLSFLMTFLAHERHGTLVGEHVHMHRNNVKKRADRIQALYGLDLDDADVRWKVMCAYAIWHAID